MKINNQYQSDGKIFEHQYYYLLFRITVDLY